MCVRGREGGREGGREMYVHVHVFVCILQLITIFVKEKLSTFNEFYAANKEFVDGLGKLFRPL